MHSSLGLAFRALVMLACLALVPLLAIYGKQLPDFYRAVVDAYKARAQAKVADPLAALGSDAPAWAPTNDRRSAASERTPKFTPTGVASASAAPSAWNGGDTSARPLAVENDLMATPSGGVQPASFAAPVEPGKSADPITTSTAGSGKAAPAPEACSVEFRHAEQRLRELGATYYLLETFGDGYRFYCRVALTGKIDSGQNRFFQAMSPDPLEAMKSVLDQVERWRSGREP